MNGDASSRAVLWISSDRATRIAVEWSTTEKMEQPRTLQGPELLSDTAFTGKLLLRGLPPGERIFYRIKLQDLDDPTLFGAPVTGSFYSPGNAAPRPLRVLWTGDTAGQGFGINLDWGGMRIYEAMRRRQPHAFIHSGDMIYADNPIPEVRKTRDGSPWKNVTTEAKSKVAETLDEFRGNYQYNLLDHNIRAFNASVAQFVQWDDHEVTNNWYPGQSLEDDDRYRVKNVDLLAARARRALQEWTPISVEPGDPTRIYRSMSLGSEAEIFLLDMRSYRAPNSSNDQPRASGATRFLGSEQCQWLIGALKRSRARWKIIASDLPVGLVVTDGDRFENLANGNGPAQGRELELAALLRQIKENRISNVVWVTADVHYTAAHHYHPDHAQYKEFLPFHEFVSGPANAGSFGPNRLDNTFGPEVLFQKAPPKPHLPPSAGYQFFGELEFDPQEGTCTVTLRDLDGNNLYQTVLQ